MWLLCLILMSIPTDISGVYQENNFRRSSISISQPLKSGNNFHLKWYDELNNYSSTNMRRTGIWNFQETDNKGNVKSEIVIFQERRPLMFIRSVSVGDVNYYTMPLFKRN